MSDKSKIALFLGSDIVAHLIMNKIVPMLISDGYEPVLYFPKHKVTAHGIDPAIKELGYYERGILQDVVYPLLEKKSYHGQKILTPRQMAEKEGLEIYDVVDVNDPAFVNRIIGMTNLAGALSVRCFQIFKPEIINVIKESGFFLNLHPGLLPQYRGVLSTARAMAATKLGTNGKDFGCTLHDIDQGIDTGDVLWSKARAFDMSKTVYATNIELAELGVQAINQFFKELRLGNSIVTVPQKDIERPKHYYTYPTSDEVAEWQSLDIRLVDPQEAKQFLLDTFTRPGSKQAKTLETALDNAITIASMKGREANGNGRLTVVGQQRNAARGKTRVPRRFGPKALINNMM